MEQREEMKKMKTLAIVALLLPIAAAAAGTANATCDGIAFDGLSPIDAAAFGIERADKDGDRIYQFTEKSGAHAREIVVVPGEGLKAEAAEVRYPNGGTAERPFVENGKIYLTFAPGEKLSLVWPRGCAQVSPPRRRRSQSSANWESRHLGGALGERALPMRLPEIVGREQPARVVRLKTVEKDGGAALEGAAWIWHPDAMKQKAVATLRTSFDIPESAAVDAATLSFSLDNGGEVRLNGHVVGRQATNSSSWMKLSVIGGSAGTPRPTELCALLKPGRNVLEATCDNFIPGDAGFIASLDLTVGGKKMRVFTNDKSWEASLDGNAFKRAKSAGMYGAKPWMRFSADGIARQKPLKKSCTTELAFDLGMSLPPGRLFFVGDGFRREVTSALKPGLNKVSEARDVKTPRLIWTAPAQGVYDLRCEYLAEPMGVVTPRFFWKWAGERPEAWKVKVWEECHGFNTEAQRRGGTEFSDRINKIDRIGAGGVAQFETKENLYVVPKMALKPFTRYRWSVEECGALGDRALPGVAVGTFVSGIEKWTKPFFKPPWKHDQKEYWIARKKVTLKKPQSVIIALASLGSHRLYVNGKPASDGFGPNRSHVEDGILLATTYDVTDLVKDGENEFKVYMHDGWAALGQCKEKESCLSVDGRAVVECGGPLGERALPDGGIVVIDSAEPWEVSLSADRSYGRLSYNCNGRNRGIEHLCDVERETRHARGVLRTGPAFTVTCDVSDRDYAIREIRPVSIEETATPGKWKIDMGEAFSGFMRLKLKGKKGTVARMTASDTFVDECVFGQIAEFEFCGGDGVFENRMNTQSGRFFYLTGCEKPGLDDVTGIVIGCCGRIHGGFKGDRDLEKILALDRNTFIATTMGGVTVDCPHRERLGYGEASLSAMWGDGMPQFDSAAYYYAYLLKWASSQRPDGSIPHVSPNGYGWGGTFWSNFPVYALADYCRRYPDARLKGIMRPVIDKWLDYLNSHVRPDGILAQYEPKKGDCLGDWLYPEIHKTKHTHGDWGHTVEGMFFNNCAYAWAIKRALGIDGLITDPARRAELERRHAALVKAIDREWYKNGLYVSEDARYQAIALLGGAADAGGHRAETEKAMQDIVEWKGYIDGGSPSYMPILRLLCATRRGRELALRTFRRREAPGFLYFADEGYNTIPEDWWYGRKSRGSMIHTCYTGPAGALFHGFAGFEIDGNKITVAPLLSDTLPNFSAYTETLYGTLYVKVESKGGRRVVWVQLPYGCEGTFVAGDRRALAPGLNRFEMPQ